MTKYLLPLCAALILLPATASAAPADSERVNDEGARVVSDGEFRELIFDEGDSLTGDLLSADGAHIDGAKAIEHAGMITIRKTFTDHLLRLANDI